MNTRKVGITDQFAIGFSGKKAKVDAEKQKEVSAQTEEFLQNNSLEAMAKYKSAIAKAGIMPAIAPVKKEYNHTAGSIEEQLVLSSLNQDLTPGAQTLKEAQKGAREVMYATGMSDRPYNARISAQTFIDEAANIPVEKLSKRTDLKSKLMAKHGEALKEKHHQDEIEALRKQTPPREYQTLKVNSYNQYVPISQQIKENSLRIQSSSQGYYNKDEVEKGVKELMIATGMSDIPYPAEYSAQTFIAEAKCDDVYKDPQRRDLKPILMQKYGEALKAKKAAEQNNNS